MFKMRDDVTNGFDNIAMHHGTTAKEGAGFLGVPNHGYGTTRQSGGELN